MPEVLDASQLGLSGVTRTRAFLDPSEAASVLERCERECTFSVLRWCAFGRTGPQPRETAFYAPPGTDYAYSGVTHRGAGMPAFLAELAARVGAQDGTSFDTVLVTRYRDGRDRVGWHSDDERELGPEPAIAILSLGANATLRFRRRERTCDQIGPRPRRSSVGIRLVAGDLLSMAPGVQRRFKHALPAAAGRGVRVSLGFRRIFTGAAAMEARA